MNCPLAILVLSNLFIPRAIFSSKPVSFAFAFGFVRDSFATSALAMVIAPISKIPWSVLLSFQE